MAGRGAQTFKKRQKEQQRKEKQEEKRAKRLQRKLDPPEDGIPDEDTQLDEAGSSLIDRGEELINAAQPLVKE